MTIENDFIKVCENNIYKKTYYDTAVVSTPTLIGFENALKTMVKSTSDNAYELKKYILSPNVEAINYYNPKLSQLIKKMQDTKRKEWIDIGIKRPESMADHSFNMAFMLLNLPKQYAGGANITKAIKMAIVHDIGTVFSDDVLYGNLNADNKYQIQSAAVKHVGENLNTPWLYPLWNEYQEQKTPEAKLIHDIKNLDTDLQVLYYINEFPRNAADLARISTGMHEKWKTNIKKFDEKIFDEIITRFVEIDPYQR